MVVDSKAIGRSVRKARKERGMTQAELAKAVRLSASYLGHIERGTRVLSVGTLVTLFRYLSMSLDTELMLGIRLAGAEDREHLERAQFCLRLALDLSVL